MPPLQCFLQRSQNSPPNTNLSGCLRKPIAGMPIHQSAKPCRSGSARIPDTPARKMLCGEADDRCRRAEKHPGNPWVSGAGDSAIEEVTGYAAARKGGKRRAFRTSHPWGTGCRERFLVANYGPYSFFPTVKRVPSLNRIKLWA